MITVSAADFDYTTPLTRSGKVRGSVLPTEYELVRFVRNVSHSEPTWTPNTEACEWYGARCDDERILLELNWASIGLRGPLSWENMPRSLEHFRGSRNKLGGSLPLGCLSEKIHTLYLSDCELVSQLDLSEMPRIMKILCLAENNFEGSIDLNHLPHDLNVLILSDNQLSGEISLNYLPPSLMDLRLSSNEFAGEVSLTNLPRTLIRIRLSGNRFCGNTDLTALPPNLNNLGLDCNRFEGKINLANLPESLRYLHLQKNMYEGSVDLSSLPPNLFWVDLTRNQLTSFGENIPYNISTELQRI